MTDSTGFLGDSTRTIFEKTRSSTTPPAISDTTRLR